MRVLAAVLALLLGLPPGGTFVDDNGSVHEGSIEAIAAAEITLGCNPPANDRFCPSESVTRGQMAAFLNRGLGLPTAVVDQFLDDDSSTFEEDINAIAQAGITLGCNPPDNDRFCPDDSVTRAQMATMLTRALGLDSAAPDLFSDDTGSTHEGAINAIGAAGITTGCESTGLNFCPDDPVTRQQMASFLARALGLDAIVPPPPSTGGEYVEPADVGVEIGVGVVAPVPTTVVGGQAITVDGTLLENVVVDGCITIDADDVTIRNVEVRCGGFYPIKINTAEHTNITIEYSRIEGLITAKLFLINDVTLLTVANNELVGGDDAVFAEGNLDGFVFTRNYRHTPLGDSSSHYDGFQLGEFSRTYGEMEISYNYFETIPDGIGVTDLVFATNESEVDISVVGNYIGEHGVYTLRAYNEATLTIRDNTFAPGITNVALLSAPGPHHFGCNVFSDGTTVTADHVAGSDTAMFESC